MKVFSISRLIWAFWCHEVSLWTETRATLPSIAVFTWPPPSLFFTLSDWKNRDGWRTILPSSLCVMVQWAMKSNWASSTHLHWRIIYSKCPCYPLPPPPQRATMAVNMTWQLFSSPLLLTPLLSLDYALWRVKLEDLFRCDDWPPGSEKLEKRTGTGLGVEAGALFGGKRWWNVVTEQKWRELDFKASLWQLEFCTFQTRNHRPGALSHNLLKFFNVGHKFFR